MNLVGQMRRNPGNWLISSDRNGGYAYAKVCSNGIFSWAENYRDSPYLSFQSVAAWRM